MSEKILIDGVFKEETRVVLLKNGVIENYDREDYNFKQLRSNIYLAKIIRIEPSLQAAFVDYGDSRHGFLPFSDIHPDYYNNLDIASVRFFEDDNIENNIVENLGGIPKVETDSETDADSSHEEEKEDILINYSVVEETEKIEHTDYTQYRIENVLKERQLLLVQVLKEERGNKGVAMTTYVSIAGKYCVLMTNTANKSGVSKKVTNLVDRKSLKSVLKQLNVPNNKSIILRTVAIEKDPKDILKDYLYLIRLWSAIRTIALESKNPTFIHAEDDIIKKVIRDWYSDNVEEIIVEGQKTFKIITNLAKIISANNNIKIKLHDENIPLFQKFNIENQLLDLYNNKVNLPSGASLVIDQTEALVSIDVNSGKATKEKTIEEMAVVINTEAAKEIAKQIRLRDLAGLIVIDFIDMFEIKNRRIVEKTMQDSTNGDRARIQIARLSIFGLMEMSRQRLSASLAERVSEVCPRCNGIGRIKSREIVALSILRAVKYATMDKQIDVVTIETTKELVDYLINYKRKEISQIEQSYNTYLFIEENLKMIDNEYNIKKRKGLTPEEKKKLEPTQKVGKVNIEFGNNEAYSINSNDVKKYKFDNKENKKSNNTILQVAKKKKFNKYKVTNNGQNKKSNWFKKFLGM